MPRSWASRDRRGARGGTGARDGGRAPGGLRRRGLSLPRGRQAAAVPGLARSARWPLRRRRRDASRGVLAPSSRPAGVPASRLPRAGSGQVRCIVCASVGVCAVCGGTRFGIRRGGAERVEGWATRSASVPVARPSRPRLPKPTGEIVVGGAELVRDLGPGELDLVAVLDADAAARAPGLVPRERPPARLVER